MQQNAPILQRLLLFGLFFCLILLSFEILKYFIVPVLWASIIAYITWPLHQKIYHWVGERKNLSAILMTSLLVLVVGIPLTIGIFVLQHEGRQLYFEVQQQLYAGKIEVPEFVQTLPFIGPEIQRIIFELNSNPHAITQNIGLWIQGHLGYGRFVVAEISRNLVKLIFAILSLFFFYRDGNLILEQVRRAFEMVIGPRIHHYFQTISETTRAVVYGVGLTAIVQSLLAGASYIVAGVPNPMVLTLVTFVFALIPFGPPIAYGSVALWLFSQGHTVEAAGVLIWGVAIVSSADNVIRPLVISGATKIPFLLIMFGVLGGLASFGLVGLFIGPVILAVLLAIWKEWLQENIQKAEDFHANADELVTEGLHTEDLDTSK
ncbi:AI-2E family transporter [Acinetobacter sp. A3.8]|uniref:AI-2E family transporter n=1 Tax=Acinetobacter sedimenti TaxID=2919922 RepID=A0A9X2B5X9_9GAMM|nr:AI-2E family transporter [Acinetobacter sedimenti]MCJ8145507.1 AI-2E family transporter [Acinetobacter sedimenti]